MNPRACLVLLLVATFGLIGHAEAEPTGTEGAKTEPAKMSFDGHTLRVATGRVERTWALTAAGLRTVAVTDTSTGVRFEGAGTPSGSDWDLPGIVPTGAAGRLLSLDSHFGNDEGFTSRYLEVDAVFAYPDGIRVRYAIWAYPLARGLRTQLWLQGSASAAKPERSARVDWVPSGGAPAGRRFFGYCNDTQHRDSWEQPILREEVRDSAAAGADESVDWASGAAVERSGAGLMLVKESQKCVNQAGVETGGFALTGDGLSNTGLRLKPTDLKPDQERWAWASWCIVYDGSDADRELALKSFYAIRYPIDPARDVYSEANTFGSGGSDHVVSLTMAHEDEVLPEIDSIADLGIDRLQIDAGWSDPGGPKTTKAWRPYPGLYPEGWTRIRARARAKGVGLGLWAPSMAIPLADLEWNYDHGGFVDWKLDFARLQNANLIDTNLAKIRAYLAYTGHRSQIVWDVTENAPRYGYFWAREYGGVWLANRKPAVPANAVYRPGVLLRDIWQLSRYVNLNKVQIPVQNLDRVSRTLSDAYRYNHPYCVAIGLAGIPLFFGTTRFYTPGERTEIRPLLAAWKQHRKDMFESVIFPVGDTPSGHSWSGFQFRHSDTDGYLLIFREPDSPDAARALALRFLAGHRLILDDLRSGETRPVTTAGDGRVDLTIPHPAGFLFLRYRAAQ